MRSRGQVGSRRENGGSQGKASQATGWDLDLRESGPRRSGLSAVSAYHPLPGASGVLLSLRGGGAPLNPCGLATALPHLCHPVLRQGTLVTGAAVPDTLPTKSASWTSSCSKGRFCSNSSAPKSMAAGRGRQCGHVVPTRFRCAGP